MSQLVSDPFTLEEATVAATLAAGSVGAAGLSVHLIVQRYRETLIELRRVGGILNPKYMKAS